MVGANVLPIAIIGLAGALAIRAIAYSINTWRKWKKATRLGPRAFMKAFIYSEVLVKPKRATRRARKWLK